MFPTVPATRWSASWILLVSLLSLPASAADAVQITQDENKVRVEISGRLFTEYHHDADTPHLYYYPVLGPGQIPMTRNAPMKEVPGEDRDHPHHRSLWYAHGAVNGVDFWAENSRAGRIVHDRFLEIQSGAKSGSIKSANRWVAPDGTIVCRDETLFRVHNHPDLRICDFEITLKASEGKDVTFGDTKEGTMGVRVAETMRLKPNRSNEGKPTGNIVLSTGVRDGDTWGKRAAWCDYYGPVEGKTMGVAILDHPDNPRHPTWWHVRDYGLFAANPFGIHDFERKPAGTGDLVVPAGESITFRYRVIFHQGNTEEAGIEKLYQDYTRE
jgi:hypothetical protein